MSASYLPKPEWLKTRLTVNRDFVRIKSMLDGNCLHTVCEEARCPNRHECWAEHKTATFIILGRVCTRNCLFCAVQSGVPKALDANEPAKVAQAVKSMGLEHAVITSVTRDDLLDGGAGHFVSTIENIRALCPGVTVEILPSDMAGRQESIQNLAQARPDILNHNLETVRRLSPKVRPQAGYERSLEFFKTARKHQPDIVLKSGLMLGLGEDRQEVLQAMDDLLSAGVQILTLGQYLQPDKKHWPVDKYWHPDEFDEFGRQALEKGFAHVQSGPLVRSSYRACVPLKSHP